MSIIYHFLNPKIQSLAPFESMFGIAPHPSLDPDHQDRSPPPIAGNNPTASPIGHCSIAAGQPGPGVRRRPSPSEPVIVRTKLGHLQTLRTL